MVVEKEVDGEADQVVDDLAKEVSSPLSGILERQLSSYFHARLHA